jgi:type IV pilus assembly protein PilV
MERMRRIARRRPEEGFTLIEVLIAFAVLAVGMLALAAMQIHAMRGGRSGRHLSEAATIARSQIEDFQRLAFADPALVATGGWSAAQTVDRVVQANPSDQVEQSYALQWRISDLNPGPTLKAIDVRVTWNEPDRPNRTVTLSTVRFGE